MFKTPDETPAAHIRMFEFILFASSPKSSLLVLFPHSGFSEDSTTWVPPPMQEALSLNCSQSEHLMGKHTRKSHPCICLYLSLPSHFSVSQIIILSVLLLFLEKELWSLFNYFYQGNYLVQRLQVILCVRVLSHVWLCDQTWCN